MSSQEQSQQEAIMNIDTAFKILDEVEGELSFIESLVSMVRVVIVECDDHLETPRCSFNLPATLEMIEKRATVVMDDISRLHLATVDLPNLFQLRKTDISEMWIVVSLLAVMRNAEMYVEECLTDKNSGPDLAAVATIVIQKIREVMNLLFTARETFHPGVM